MIIRPMSDIHLEFDGMAPWYMPRIAGEKDMVLILAGDITANHNQWKNNPARDTYTPWIKDVCARHKAVIYVKGNHEDYAGHMEATEDHWKAMANHIDNLHFLHRDTVVIDGVRFIGCTLWTPLNNPMDALVANQMNDFNMIWANDELFTVMQWKLEHEACRYFIETELAKEFDGETVVVTHHAPSFQSIHEKYQGDRLSVCYANNLDSLMWYNPIKLWIHGHVHDSMDYIVGDELQSTRVICNPRGYESYGEANMDFNPKLTIEV
jgi:UDP-2,3-diacylglucosamine pyrophosphatase LpxH